MAKKFFSSSALPSFHSSWGLFDRYDNCSLSQITFFDEKNVKMFKALRRSTSGGNSSTSSPAKNASSAAAAAAAGSAAAAAAAAASAAALASPASANTEALCGRLAVEIRGQETLHASLLKVQLYYFFLGFNPYFLTTSFQDLARLAASPSVSEEDFHATFLKALSRSGLETR